MLKSFSLSSDKKTIIFDLSSDKKLKSFANQLEASLIQINKMEAYLTRPLPRNLLEAENQALLFQETTLSKENAINEKYKARVDRLEKIAIGFILTFIILIPLLLVTFPFLLSFSGFSRNRLLKYTLERDQALDEVKIAHTKPYLALIKKFKGEFKLEAEFFGQSGESLNQANREILSSLKLINSLPVSASEEQDKRNKEREALVEKLNGYNEEIKSLSKRIARIRKSEVPFVLKTDYILELDDLEFKKERVERELADHTSKDKSIKTQKQVKSVEVQLLSALEKRTKVLCELLGKEKENHRNAPIVQLITHYRIDKKTAILYELLRRKKDSRHNISIAQPITNSVYTGLDLTPKRSKWMAFYGRNNCQAKAIAYNSSNNRQNREKTIKNCPGL